MTYDVIVVGGGAAGLSAALVLGRARRRVAVIDAGEPRNKPAAHMQGYLSRDGMPPAELLAAGREEVQAYGVELIAGRVARITPELEVELSDGRVLHARRLVLATGVRDEIPDLPGVRERWGRDLLHCPYCHGWEVRDQPLGVLGTNDESVQHALLIRQWSDDVVFFVHTLPLSDDDRDRLRSRDISVVGYGDYAAATQITPQLTTIRVPGEEMGIAAFQLLLERIERPRPDTASYRRILICPQIIERQSLAPV